MRPLPRLHAVTDRAVLALPDLPVRAAAIAAAGSAVALHARDREATGAALTHIARKLLALTRPPESGVIVNARADIAAALAAQGVQLGAGDLTPAEVRRVFPGWHGWIGASVHSVAEARAQASAGVDYLIVGSIYPTASHPGRRPAGLALVRETVPLGLPVIAIGGITAARAREVRDAGAWGVASISAVWGADEPAAAALALLEPWAEAA